MSDWTPEEIRAVLRGADRARERALVVDLTRAAEAGHVNYLYRRPGYREAARYNRQDDVQETMVLLFKAGARVLLKYGQQPDFVASPGALRRFVIGVTWNVMRKRYQDQPPRWEQIEHDMRSIDDQTRTHQLMDLKRARESLSARDQELFELVYVAQCEPEEICRTRGIQRNALDAQKSRLVKRLSRYLRGEPGVKEGDDA